MYSKTETAKTASASPDSPELLAIGLRQRVSARGVAGNADNSATYLPKTGETGSGRQSIKLLLYVFLKG